MVLLDEDFVIFWAAGRMTSSATAPAGLSGWTGVAGFAFADSFAAGNGEDAGRPVADAEVFRGLLGGNTCLAGVAFCGTDLPAGAEPDFAGRTGFAARILPVLLLFPALFPPGFTPAGFADFAGAGFAPPLAPAFAALPDFGAGGLPVPAFPAFAFGAGGLPDREAAFAPLPATGFAGDFAEDADFPPLPPFDFAESAFAAGLPPLAGDLGREGAFAAALPDALFADVFPALDAAVLPVLVFATTAFAALPDFALAVLSDLGFAIASPHRKSNDMAGI